VGGSIPGDGRDIHFD